MFSFLVILTLALPQTPQDGLTLFAPLEGYGTHLLDINFNVVHTWNDTARPGVSAYLLPNGNLLRTYKIIGSPASQLDGAGGGIHELRWDGTEVWDYQYASNDYLMHHDVEILPNGNLLLMSWEDKTDAGAILAGHDPAQLSSPLFWSERIFEIEPLSGTVVWEWHLWDHLVQDFDANLANFGVIADNPQLVNLNFPAAPDPDGDWAHLNTVQYNAAFDQIVLSSRNLSEVWIIDHSTTTAEAATSSGGARGHGGDLLYRWGNPQAYDRGTSADQRLFGQHDIQWIPDGYPGAGNFLVFNNGLGRTSTPWSSVDEFTPPVDSSGNYTLAPSVAFGPTGEVWTYFDTPANFYADHISGAERMPNGNTLICDGPAGRLFEVDAAGVVVWDWTSPLPTPAQNKIFKVRRYQRSLWPGDGTLSVSSMSTVEFGMVAGSAHAGKDYALLGTKSGITPGSVLAGGVWLPLNQDSFTAKTLHHAGSGNLVGFAGQLDSLGNATARLRTNPASNPALIGRTLYFAFVIIDPLTGYAEFASNPVPVEIFP